LLELPETLTVALPPAPALMLKPPSVMLPNRLRVALPPASSRIADKELLDGATAPPTTGRCCSSRFGFCTHQC